MTKTTPSHRARSVAGLAYVFLFGVLLGLLSRTAAVAAAPVEPTPLPTVAVPPTFVPLPGPSHTPAFDTPRPSPTSKLLAPSRTPGPLEIGAGQGPIRLRLEQATETATPGATSPPDTDTPPPPTASPTSSETPPPTNTALPTVPPLPPINRVCSNPRQVFHLTLEALPDVSGRPWPGTSCTGCDRYFGGGDAQTAAGCPLPPLPYEITMPGRSGSIRGIIDQRGMYGVERRIQLALCDPADRIIITIQRPVQVNDCRYILCPYSDQTYTRVVERRKFKKPRNALTVTWFFWECEPFQPSPTPTATDTASPTPTFTPSPTWTNTPTPTNTSTPTPTDTPTPTRTNTPTPTPTSTPSPTPTFTPTPTRTNTLTPTPTPTFTPSPTPTNTSTPSPTPTSTSSPTPTRTNTPTPTFTPSPTPTWTSSPTPSPTATSTPTPTPTWTRTPTPTGTAQRPTEQPQRPTPAWPECDQACLRIHKFRDLNGNGLADPGEPMLAGLRFDVTVNGEIYVGETDADGLLVMCFSEGDIVAIRESQASGGLWQITSDERRLDFRLPCGLHEVWIGNAPVGLPKTGLGGGRKPPPQRSSPASGGARLL